MQLSIDNSEYVHQCICTPTNFIFFHALWYLYEIQATPVSAVTTILKVISLESDKNIVHLIRFRTMSANNEISASHLLFGLLHTGAYVVIFSTDSVVQHL